MIERVDAEHAASEDRLDHKVHHQCPDRFFVEPRDIKRTDRAARLSQRLRYALALRGNEIANGATGHLVESGSGCHRRINPIALASRVKPQHRHQMLAWAIHEQLQLTVLIERAETGNRRRALAFLAEAFSPQLDEPMGEPTEPV